MRAGEREWCVVVIEDRSGPGGGRVAGCARSGETGSYVIGIGRAGVIRLVARIAIGRRTCEHVIDVA